MAGLNMGLDNFMTMNDSFSSQDSYCESSNPITSSSTWFAEISGKWCLRSKKALPWVLF